MTDVSLRRRIYRTFTLLFSVIILHILLMWWLEPISLWQAVWLTLTTVTTVGYGDLSASTELGQLATIILLFMLGITLLAMLAGDYVDYRLERRHDMLKGLWRWNMQDHLVIINTPKQQGVRYFERMVGQLRDTEQFREKPILILTTAFPDGLPLSLREQGVVHFHGETDDQNSLEHADIQKASHIVVLAEDTESRRSDSLTLDLLHRLQSLAPKAHIVTEAVEDDNRDRLVELGASGVIRPVRAYPEILVRTLVAPGSEQVLENLFTQDGIHTERFNITVSDKRWADIVYALMREDLGTAVAYIDNQQNIVCHPKPTDRIHAWGLFIMIRSNHTPSEKAIIEALS